ncbi:hypothetical protein V6N12_016381 [Hibiscus sabdariffa]|uniref:RRM domain-containing protein n=1 Tax=Hibiscus sabdariffa TaxID=183260 RepID=A0ABR2CDF3_9ROSI
MVSVLIQQAQPKLATKGKPTPNGASLRLTINDSKRHERAREGEGSSSANVRVLVGLVRKRKRQCLKFFHFSMDRKLVVLGIPWEVDTEGLREYMSKYGDLEDCIVMKERSTSRSRGFGYVTFASAGDAKRVLYREHFLGERMLEVKIATPKEEMRAPVKKVTRIFVARIPPSVDESTFRR